MHKPYTQKELKEEWLRRHAAQLETTPIFCDGNKFVTELPKRWYDSWFVVIAVLVLWGTAFYFGYDAAQGTCDVSR